MKYFFLAAMLAVAAPLFGQAVCPPVGTPDPWGLGRPVEWVMNYTYYFNDGSITNLKRDVCRGDPAITGDTSLLVWWSFNTNGCPTDAPCLASAWPIDSYYWWWLPPSLQVYQRRRAA